MHLEVGVAIPAAEGLEGRDASARKGARKHLPAEIRNPGCVWVPVDSSVLPSGLRFVALLPWQI